MNYQGKPHGGSGARGGDLTAKSISSSGRFDRVPLFGDRTI